MTRRGLVLTITISALAALAPIGAAADAGASLTVPAQVQANATTAAVVQPSFTYPEATPFCTVGVDFTWDGGAWLSEFPTKNGALCVAGGVNASAPAGKGTAGSHQVCGSAGPRYTDCKTISIVFVAGAAPATPRPAPGILQPTAPIPTPTAAPAEPLTIPSNAPVPRAVARVVNGVPAQEREIGLVLFTVGVLGLLAIAVRRFLNSRKRRPTPLPSPGGRRG